MELIISHNGKSKATFGLIESERKAKREKIRGKKNLEFVVLH